MRLLLIRHGQTSSNVAGALDTGMPGAHLTSLGRRQAAAVPPALAGEPLAAVYASPLTRAGQTAEPLARTRGLEVRVRPGLEEIPAGDLEMRSDEEAVAAYAACGAAWMRGDLGRAMPGGPDGHTFRERYDAAVRAIAGLHDEQDTVALVSHGAAIRVWSALAGAVDPEEAAARRVPNTGLVAVEGHPEQGWRLTAWWTEPLGGPGLLDPGAHDVTGDSSDEAVSETR